MTITSTQIIDMFQIAHDTDKKLPAVYKKGANSMKFDIVPEKSDHGAWSKNPVRIAATSQEIKIYEYCLFYLYPIMGVQERKMIHARTFGAPWHWIGSNILKCSRHTAKKRYLETIRMLRMRIAISADLMEKLPRLTADVSNTK